MYGTFVFRIRFSDYCSLIRQVQYLIYSRLNVKSIGLLTEMHTDEFDCWTELIGDVFNALLGRDYLIPIKKKNWDWKDIVLELTLGVAFNATFEVISLRAPQI